MDTKNTKGILLAGGAGSRLYPLSKVYSKQLVAVYDKPMIYYPMATLINAGIKEILIIADSNTIPFYQKLFENSTENNLGITIQYAVQEKPNGIAEAFIIGKDFIGKDNVALILGDNIFYGCDEIFRKEIERGYNTIFALYVKDPEQYGVVQFSAQNIANKIIEKPMNFVSNYAVPGFYIYDSSVVEVATKLKPSNRGELEITDINNHYLQQFNLDIILLNKGVTWLDSGTPDSLLAASNFIASIEQRHNIKVGCYEEAAYRMKFIARKQLLDYTNTLPNCAYKDYLLFVSNNMQDNLDF
ncbi:MAG: NTP transferase domain-containing protein [Ignavibacteria bacterium]|jgi:glucose-1-phosphate thymidylyltransferase|nr:NTP transferase domain-containing protein [Ignavibacteria bacterium]